MILDAVEAGCESRREHGTSPALFLLALSLPSAAPSSASQHPPPSSADGGTAASGGSEGRWLAGAVLWRWKKQPRAKT